ncbi:MAG: GNAT family protein [Candidatus Kapaibacterium sp.]
MSATATGPAYRIRSERLIIRCPRPEDAPLLKTAVDESLEHLRPWMPWAELEPQELQAKIDLLRIWRGEFDLGRDFTYLILSDDESAVLGGCGLHTRAGADAREIGYWVHAGHVNRGIATELAGALTRVAFQIDKVRRVDIRCDSENLRSARVPEKLGFIHEATLRKRLFDSGNSPRNTMVWTMFEDEFPGSGAAATAMEAYDAIGRKFL